MSRQEEIREGIEIGVLNIIFNDRHLRTESLTNGMLAKEILSYLHSQGVVIKVDKELPKVVYEDQREKTIALVTQLVMCAEGYVAVEPLVSEEINEQETH